MAKVSLRPAVSLFATAYRRWHVIKYVSVVAVWRHRRAEPSIKAIHCGDLSRPLRHYGPGRRRQASLILAHQEILSSIMRHKRRSIDMRIKARQYAIKSRQSVNAAVGRQSCLCRGVAKMYRHSRVSGDGLLAWQRPRAASARGARNSAAP